jgi:Berberine and berberine like
MKPMSLIGLPWPVLSCLGTTQVCTPPSHTTCTYRASLSTADTSCATTAGATNIWKRKIVSNILVPDQDTLSRLATTAYTIPSPMMFAGYWGGKIKEGKAGVYNQAMRDALVEVWLAHEWHEPEDDVSNILTVQAAFEQFNNSLTPHSYINELGSWGKYCRFNDWKTRLFPNYKQLMQVKKSYDPCNLYTVPFGVGSDAPTATCK